MTTHLGRHLAWSQIVAEADLSQVVYVVDFVVNVNKFLKFVHAFPAICDDLRQSWMPILGTTNKCSAPVEEWEMHLPWGAS